MKPTERSFLLPSNLYCSLSTSIPATCVIQSRLKKDPDPNYYPFRSSTDAVLLASSSFLILLTQFILVYPPSQAFPFALCIVLFFTFLSSDHSWCENSIDFPLFGCCLTCCPFHLFWRKDNWGWNELVNNSVFCDVTHFVWGFCHFMQRSALIL